MYLRLRSCIILNAIQCHDFVRNSEVSLRTGLAPVSDWITRGRNAIFGHVARLSDNTPAHHAMLCQVELSVGRPQTLHGNVLQVDHVPNGLTKSTKITTVSPLRLWRQAIGRGHSRAMLLSEPTMR